MVVKMHFTSGLEIGRCHSMRGAKERSFSGGKLLGRREDLNVSKIDEVVVVTAARLIGRHDGFVSDVLRTGVIMEYTVHGS